MSPERQRQLIDQAARALLDEPAAVPATAPTGAGEHRFTAEELAALFSAAGVRCDPVEDLARAHQPCPGVRGQDPA